MIHSATSRFIASSVRSKYEAHPFPEVKIWETIDSGDYYHHSSLFAAKLFEHHFPNCSHAVWQHMVDPYSTNSVLVAGCGEVLPVAMARLEPRNHHLVGVDICKSVLHRAKFRLYKTLDSFKFVRAPIEEFITDSRQRFTHIDASHLLEYTTNPKDIIAGMGDMLVPNGTIRISVNNSYSKRWMRQLRRAFSSLELKATNPKDIALATKLLDIATEYSSVLGRRIKQVSNHKKLTTSELVEFFFHPYENIYEVHDWMKWIDEAGLQVYGVFDRFGELSDIENPLLVPPDADTLQKRINLGFMKGPLELYLCSQDRRKRDWVKRKRKVKTSFRLRKAWHLPKFWQQNPFLKDTSMPKIYRIWLQNLYSAYQRDHSGLGLIGALEDSYTDQEIKSFARYGAVLPSMLKDQRAIKKLYDPITKSQKMTREHQVVDFFDTALAYKIERELRKRNLYDSKRFYVIMERFVQSQF